MIMKKANVYFEDKLVSTITYDKLIDCNSGFDIILKGKSIGYLPYTYFIIEIEDDKLE